MELPQKHIHDILIKAEWLEQISFVESTEQKGVFESVMNFRTGDSQLENGKFKLWMLSKLHRELAKGGLTSWEELRAMIQLGVGLGIQAGWEPLPPN